MSITVELTDDREWADRAPFEVMPRAGEVIYWTYGEELRPLRVIGVSHYPARHDFQAQVHVELVPT